MISKINPLIQAVFYNNPDLYPPIINSSRLLACENIQVDILCRENGQHWGVTYPEAVTIRRFEHKSAPSWQAYLPFVVTVWRQGRRDASLFVGHDMHGLLPARLLASRYKRPLVYHCHDFADKSRHLPTGSRVVRMFERLFAKTADLVIVPDKERAQVVLRELNLPKFPLIVANSPIRPYAVSSHRLSQSLGALNKKYNRILLRQGRIAVGHAIEATLQSMPLWQDPSWAFVIVGLAEENYRQHLWRLASLLGVEDRFVILPPVNYDEVQSYTVSADAGHALYEPIHINNMFITTASNKIMEYMAAGLPLLVSDRPGLRDLVQDYACGMVADENSPDSIAQAVNSLFCNPEVTRQLGEASLKAFVDKYNYKYQFDPVLKAMGALINQSRA